jgi:CHRD domain
MTRAGLARLSAAFVASVCLSVLVVSAQGGGHRFSAVLIGDDEVPAVSTEAGGTLTIDIDEQGGEIDWELTYSDLQAAVSQAHIHFAQPGINGGIVLWFCKTNQPSPPAPASLTTICPQTGTLSGTFTQSDVQAVGSQQITAADFEAAVALIKKGFAYANVHTAASPGGEIRGQLKPGGGANK